MGNCACVESKSKLQKHPLSPNSSTPLPKTQTPTTSSSLIKDITDDYIFTKVLGEGHFGIVRSAISKQDPNLTVAVKSIYKKILKKELHLLKREVENLASLDHPNILKFYESYEDLKYFHIVTECCTGGVLMSRVAEVGHYNEKEAANMMYKMLLAVNHLHSKGFCHRDLKPENFVFENELDDAELKLIDFGLSTRFGSRYHKMGSIVGTPNYVAPEILNGEYGFECDMWSIGVIMYKLLSGLYPFIGENPGELLHNLLTDKLKFRGEIWNSISNEAKDLIMKLIERNPSDRYTAEMALDHVWLDQTIARSKILLDSDILDSLKSFKSHSKLQQEAYSVLVKYLSIDQIKELRTAFRALDQANTGFLSLKDIKKALKKYGMRLHKKELKEILNNTSFHHDGHINYSEFLAATLSSKVAIDEELICKVFKKFDLSNCGNITAEDLKEVLRRLGEDFTDSEVQKMLHDETLNDEGLMSFQEFRKLFNMSECADNESAKKTSDGARSSNKDVGSMSYDE